MKIVILDGYTENPGDLSWEGFEGLGETIVYDRTEPDEILPRSLGAEIVITNKTPLTRETINALSGHLRYIGVLATGYNVVDIVAARENNIPVANIPTYGTTAVAQMTFALLLELCHHVGAHSELVHAGEWEKCPDFCFWRYPLVELAGKTMGIIGYGRIGRAVGKLAKAFQMNVLCFDAHAPGDENAQSVSLETLLAASDVVSLHCPLFPETKEIINKNTISKMKDGAFLINTSRGPLIQEQDLAAALTSGKLGGAALDVLTKEPASSDSPLFHAPNCLITPHIAWAPKESRQRLMDIAVANLQAFLREKPQNIVN